MMDLPLMGDRNERVTRLKEQNTSLYILTAYHLSPENVETEGKSCLSSKSQRQHMKRIIVSYGGYAHGTSKEHGNITSESLNDD